MAFSTATISHSYRNSDSSAASGTLTFALTGRMGNGGTSYLPSSPLNVSLDSSGDLSVVLVANDDVGTTPLNVQWICTSKIAGADDETYYLTVPSASAGKTVDLFSLLPSQQQVG